MVESIEFCKGLFCGDGVLDGGFFGEEVKKESLSGSNGAEREVFEFCL